MRRLLISIVAVGALAGCRGQTSKETPLFGIRNMYDQPKYEIQGESDFYPDHRTMRPLVEGVISQEEEVDPRIAQGRLEDQSGYVLEIPREVVGRAGGMQALVERGKARYGIYCQPCHDGTGSGNGAVRKHAAATGATAFAPPTFHQDRLRHAPDGQIFATITNGKNNMPPYAMQIPVQDRWAIVSFVRALQIAQPKIVEQPALSPTAMPATSAPAPGGTILPPPPGSGLAPALIGSAPAPSSSAPATPSAAPSAAPAHAGDAGAKP